MNMSMFKQNDLQFICQYTDYREKYRRCLEHESDSCIFVHCSIVDNQCVDVFSSELITQSVRQGKED